MDPVSPLPRRLGGRCRQFCFYKPFPLSHIHSIRAPTQRVPFPVVTKRQIGATFFNTGHPLCLPGVSFPFAVAPDFFRCPVSWVIRLVFWGETVIRSFRFVDTVSFMVPFRVSASFSFGRMFHYKDPSDLFFPWRSRSGFSEVFRFGQQRSFSSRLPAPSQKGSATFRVWRAR